MGKMITGSLDLTAILEKAKSKHSAFSKSEKNGHIYMSVLIWENDEPDKFNNNFSVQLNAAKDAPESDRKQYIGNLKYQAAPAPQPVAESDLPDSSELPF